MSRIANKPVQVISGVTLDIKDNLVKAKGPKGEMQLQVHESIEIKQDGDEIMMVPRNEDARPMSGTMRSLLHNVIIGVSEGFTKKLQLVGVGYRAQMKGQDIDLTLGFSHPVVYKAKEGITFEVPSQTEIVINGVDKQKVGQVAAEIRAIRPPEPYKGKGVKYADERLYRKEAKKA